MSLKIVILQKKPQSIYLTLVIVGATILAIPGCFGVYAIFSGYNGNSMLNEPNSMNFIYVAAIGFMLLCGYFLTAIFQKHSAFFWLCSLLYNLAFSGLYIFLIFGEIKISKAYPSNNHLNTEMVSFYLLFLSWTAFVTFASGYYLKYKLFNRKTLLL